MARSPLCSLTNRHILLLDSDLGRGKLGDFAEAGTRELLLDCLKIALAPTAILRFDEDHHVLEASRNVCLGVTRVFLQGGILQDVTGSRQLDTTSE